MLRPETGKATSPEDDVTFKMVNLKEDEKVTIKKRITDGYDNKHHLCHLHKQQCSLCERSEEMAAF